MRRRGVWLCLGLIVVTASPSIAQYGLGAQSTLIDSSVRLSGMGRTGAAVFWGGDLNDWSNPAVLAYSRGLRFERSKTQLVRDLANDVFFTTNRLIVGAWGIGVAIAGRPIDALGGDRLDYGVSIATDVDGNELGRFRTLEDENAISLGLSVAQLLRSAGLAAGHRFPAIDRYVDASLGHSWKHVSHWDVGTSTFLGQGDVNKQDRGYLIRVTPYNPVDSPRFIPGLDSALRARIEASYGASELNYDGSTRVNYSSGVSLPVAEDHRRATAFHVGIALPKSLEDHWRDSRRGWIYDLITPILSFGRSSERSQRLIDGNEAGSRVEQSGWEISVANIYSYRKGHIDDPTGTVIGDTSGWGLGLHLGNLVGVQYDHATIPQSVYLGRVKRNGFSVYLDPVNAVRRLW